MIIRLRARPQAFLQAFGKARVPAPLRQARCLHSVQALPRHAEFEKNGIPGFLSPRGYKINYLEYQQYLCDYLNQQTADGGVLEDHTATELIALFSRDRSNASLFNHASMAFNNAFFFRGLSYEETKPQDTLLADIESSFGSFNDLRAEFLENANAIFGNGFVWLMVENESGNMRMLNTYNAGSPLPVAHNRSRIVPEGYDANTTPQNRQITQELAARNILTGKIAADNYAGSFGNHSRTNANNPSLPPGGLNATPLLCVNVWEHMWVMDYGLINKRRGDLAKKDYLSAWWLRIDWNRVHNLLNESSYHRVSQKNKAAPNARYDSAVKSYMNQSLKM